MLATYKRLRLIADFLDDAAYRASNRSCNDWSWPADWSNSERAEMVREMLRANGTPEAFDPDNLSVMDWQIIQHLADWIRCETEIHTPEREG
jgi:hypothetical protein